MNADSRWPGSVQYTKVFANLSISQKLRDEELPIAFQEVTHGRCKVSNYLKVDPAFPLTSYCMKACTSCTTDSRIIFNNMSNLARNPIKCPFGRLKVRWNFLNKRVDLQLKFVPTTNYVCFVLH